VIEQIQRVIDALPPGHLTSMHEEIIGGRPSELEYWSGAVVRLGREAGVATHMHQAKKHKSLQLRVI
jgi:2-dehydropantoate 2-reductase